MRGVLRIAVAAVILAASAVQAHSQDWEDIRQDGSFLWGDGWGRSVEEADREALAALGRRIGTAVRSDFRHTESERVTDRRTAYVSTTELTLSVSSFSRLCNSRMEVLREGRRSHVVRWIPRAEVEDMFSDRKDRALEYETMALDAEADLRLGDALRYHYWAYVTAKSLARPAELRDADGRMLVIAIPERMNALFSGLAVKATRNGDILSLTFTYRGHLVKSMDFSYFDGRAWSGRTSVRDGSATARLAAGALGEYVQLRVEYAYREEAGSDEELTPAMTDNVPFRRSQIIFRR